MLLRERLAEIVNQEVFHRDLEQVLVKQGFTQEEAKQGAKLIIEEGINRRGVVESGLSPEAGGY